MPPKRKTNLNRETIYQRRLMKQKQKQNQRQTVVVHVHTTKPGARRRRTTTGKTQQSRGSNYITVQPSLAVTTNPIPQMYSPHPQQNSLEQLGIKPPVNTSVASILDAFLPVHPYVEPLRPLATNPLHGATIENINNTLTSALKGRNLTLSPVAAQDDDDEEVAGFSRSSSPPNAFDIPFDSFDDIENHVEKPVTVTQNVPAQNVLKLENPANTTSGYADMIQQWEERSHKSPVENATSVERAVYFKDPVKYPDSGNPVTSTVKIRKPRCDKGISRGSYIPRFPSSKRVTYEDDDKDD